MVSCKVSEQYTQSMGAAWADAPEKTCTTRIRKKDSQGSSEMQVTRHKLPQD